MPKKRKKKPFNKKTWLIAKLRRVSLFYPPRNEARSLARVERGMYRCAICKNTFHHKEIHMDHINPIVDVKTGWTNWDDYMERMFPDTHDLFQVLCLQCHDIKTLAEQKQRFKNYK